MSRRLQERKHATTTTGAHDRKVPREKRKKRGTSRELPERLLVSPATRVRYSSYVTAACVELRGLSDEEDCYELRLLHLFCNDHVARLPDAPAILDGYRRMEARVMRALGRMDPDDVQKIYQDIDEEAVTPVVPLILAGMWDEAHALYGIARAEIEDLLRGEGPAGQDGCRKRHEVAPCYGWDHA